MIRCQAVIVNCHCSAIGHGNGHHASMARCRCIETPSPAMVRCAIALLLQRFFWCLNFMFPDFKKTSCCFEFKSPWPLSAVYDDDVRAAHARQLRCCCLFWRISFSSTNNTINKISVSPTNLFHLTKYGRGCIRKDARGASGVQWSGNEGLTPPGHAVCVKEVGWWAWQA